MQHELQRLLPRHYEVMRLCLLGYMAKDIALTLNLSPVGVGLIINSPLFQDELARRRDSKIKKEDDIETITAIDILEKAAPTAAQKHIDLLSSKSERVAQASANTILDKVLQTKQGDRTIIQIDNAVVNLLHVTIQELKDAGFTENVPKIERADVAAV